MCSMIPSARTTSAGSTRSGGRPSRRPAAAGSPAASGHRDERKRGGEVLGGASTPRRSRRSGTGCRAFVAGARPRSAATPGTRDSRARSAARRHRTIAVPQHLAHRPDATAEHDHLRIPGQRQHQTAARGSGRRRRRPTAAAPVGVTGGRRHAARPAAAVRSGLGHSRFTIAAPEAIASMQPTLTADARAGHSKSIGMWPISPASMWCCPATSGRRARSKPGGDPGADAQVSRGRRRAGPWRSSNQSAPSAATRTSCSTWTATPSSAAKQPTRRSTSSRPEADVDGQGAPCRGGGRRVPGMPMPTTSTPVVGRTSDRPRPRRCRPRPPRPPPPAAPRLRRQACWHGDRPSPSSVDAHGEPSWSSPRRRCRSRARAGRVQRHAHEAARVSTDGPAGSKQLHAAAGRRTGSVGAPGSAAVLRRQ